MTAASRVVLSAPTRAERYVRSLELVNDVTLVGGKAHALGRAMRAGIRVPAGFALTTGHSPMEISSSRRSLPVSRRDRRSSRKKSSGQCCRLSECHL